LRLFFLHKNYRIASHTFYVIFAFFVSPVRFHSG
jgi:hypothetical protein